MSKEEKNKELLNKLIKLTKLCEELQADNEWLNKQYETLFDLVNNCISKDKIRELLDRFDLEEKLQNEYDELLGSEAVIKILKSLLKGI